MIIIIIIIVVVIAWISRAGALEIRNYLLSPKWRPVIKPSNSAIQT